MKINPSNIEIRLEVRAVLETYNGWNVSARDEADPVFIVGEPDVNIAIDDRGHKSYSRDRVNHDVCGVRDALFKVDSPQDAQEFLRTYGPLRLNGSHSTVRLSEIRLLRDLRQEFLLKGSTRGDFQRNGVGAPALNTIGAIFDAAAMQPVPVALTREGSRIVGLIRCPDVEQATQAAVYLDRVSGYGWAECEECLAVYKKTSRHQRKFCSAQCLSYSTTQAALHPSRTPAWRRKRIGRRKQA